MVWHALLTLALVGQVPAPGYETRISLTDQQVVFTQNQPPVIPETVVEAPRPVSDGFYVDALPAGAGGTFTTRRSDDVIGQMRSASEGVIGQPDLQNRPLLRPASALELVPGVIATQHSGSGKANQYFLRGFNLDHGTDFFVRVDGVPINLTTHAHGQGYLDLNWLIPEIIDTVQYKKGPYYAEYGDFNAAGGADFRLARTLPYGIAQGTVGAFEYYRALIANSFQLGEGNVLYAYESVYNNGPWVVPEEFNKFNGVLSYSQGDDEQGMSVSAWAYRSYWTATNQIPQMAVDSGLVSRFGSLDPSDGGKTDRITLNSQVWNKTEYGITRANAYLAYYDLALYSNFTFFLDDQVNGDQIEQIDSRIYGGMNLSHEWEGSLSNHTVGLQYRDDSIGNVALNHTNQRQLVDQVSQDKVNVSILSTYYANQTPVTDQLRSLVGLRGDWYRAQDQDLLNPADSGNESAAIFSPKVGLIWEPVDSTDLFINWGLGFHSNDARGVTSQVNPATALVRANGSEIGMRTYVTEKLVTTLTAWYLELDSELVFVGDAGTTEPAGASHRGGLELTNYYTVSDWTYIDCDYAWVRPRLMGGERIPNAVENVLSTGITTRDPDPSGGFFGSIRVQSYGPAALIEDNSARSHVTTVVNMQTGYRRNDWQLAVDIFNLLNAKANDIVYFYESRPTPGGLAVSDYHFHPVMPTGARITLTRRF